MRLNQNLKNQFQNYKKYCWEIRENETITRKQFNSQHTIEQANCWRFKGYKQKIKC